ncbi:unnamed protein product [Dovyalis caffra]|uniref:DUF7610 domain-containing protein n=1 Tax=Dovyalis caffra TaxID=77055 RepID=A0AAV1RLS7_9ROSI|nr:unnamed protein product [Dovyalis caffra]
MLQRKLKELEHELMNKVFSLSAGTPLPKLYTQDVEQRFFFLKTLLSAETASSSKKSQFCLQLIGKRLSDLETAFYDWSDNNETVLTAQDQLGNVSCTESCLDDDGDQTSEETGLHEFEEAENVFQSLIEVKKPLKETVRVLEKKSDLIKNRSGRFCGGMASGVVIGMALMGFVMVTLSECFPYLKHSVCLPPT